MSAIELRRADSGSQVAACFSAMAEPCPHLLDTAECIALIGQQQKADYRLLDAVAEAARKDGIELPVLDTALDNLLAHRFYYRQGLLARALRFSRPNTR